MSGICARSGKMGAAREKGSLSSSCKSETRGQNRKENRAGGPVRALEVPKGNSWLSGGEIERGEGNQPCSNQSEAKKSACPPRQKNRRENEYWGDGVSREYLRYQREKIVVKKKRVENGTRKCRQIRFGRKAWIVGAGKRTRVRVWVYLRNPLKKKDGAHEKR